MTRRALTLAWVGLGLAGLACSTARGQVLYSQNFDAPGQSALWNVNAPPAPNNTDVHTDFHFDYSTFGIPAAPNSGGTTHGMKLAANLTDGIAGGVSVSPTDKSFTGDYALRFDLWSNFLGAESATNPAEAGIWEGGPGSTHFSSYGILSSGTGANFHSGTRAGVAEALYFSNTGDGQQTFDYHVRGPGNPTTDHGPSGFRATTEMGSATAFNNWDAVLDAGVTYHDTYPVGHADEGETNRGVGYDADDAGATADGFLYIDAFPSVTAPAGQTALYPFTQYGQTMPGAMGMAWREVEIKKVGDIVTWSVLNGGANFDQTFTFATVDLSLLKVPANSGNNIMFGHSDLFSGTSADPDYAELMFTVIDNVRVEAIESVPEDDADFDGDGDVDGADMLTWQRNLGTNGGQPQGNADGQGAVDAADLAVWEGQFSAGGGAIAVIPEPATACLAGLAAVAILACRRSFAC
ncbi:MAG TPA: hypothetical protein VF175_11265 [Lacipirellula sp.]